MTARLRRMIDLGAGGSLYPGSSGDLRHHGNVEHLLEAGATWVRLWADWPTLQPDPGVAIDDPASRGAPWLAALDEQIATACAAGLRVVLTLYRFPLWANGLQDLGTRRDSDEEIAFLPEDRMTPEAWARYLREGRDPTVYNPARRGLEFRIPPEGLGTESAWARFFTFLYARYHHGQRASGRWVRGFELTNEPNHQWWPKWSPSTTTDPFAVAEPTLPVAYAQAMVTAQEIARAHGDTTRLLGPSVSDSTVLTRHVMAWDTFVPVLLDALDALGFAPSARMTWAHHNYTDLELRRQEPVAQQLRTLLSGRWRGARTDGGPSIWMTEGGARLASMRRYYPDVDPLESQRSTWQVAWERYASSDGIGAGVAMLAQYTLHADPRFDSGLLEPWPSEVRRPAYDLWTTLPRYA